VQFRSDEESDDLWVGGQVFWKLEQTVNGQVGLFVDDLKLRLLIEKW
jgi:hypothetical protein